MKVVDRSELNGKIADERDDLIVDLGKLTEQIKEANNDRLTPGRISSFEAMRMLPLVSDLLVVAATMQAELNTIISESESD